MSLEDDKLREIVKWKKRRRVHREKLVGEILGQYVETNIKPKQKKASPMVDAWHEVVPPGFVEHCKILKAERGVLTVLVGDAVFMYQLQMMKQELLAELRDKCKRVKVKDIKFQIGDLGQ